MDLARSFNEVLKVSPCKEVSKIHEFAVVLILDVDDTPAVLATPNLLSIDDDVLLTSNNGKRNDVLTQWLMKHQVLPSRTVNLP